MIYTMTEYAVFTVIAEGICHGALEAEQPKREAPEPVFSGFRSVPENQLRSVILA